MKLTRKFLPFAAAFVVALTAAGARGQLRAPRPSQKASVMQTVGVTDITIIYSRPAVKGRTVWGDPPAGAPTTEATLDDARTRVKGAPLVPYGHDWRTPLQAANYAFNNNVATDEAMQWLEKSIKTKETFGNLYAKARALAGRGKTAEAVALGEKALQLAKAPDSGVDQVTIADVEKRVADWKAKM